MRIEDYEIWKRIRYIINNPNEKKRLTDDEWLKLDKAINMVYPNFSKKLSALCKMSLNDYHLCLLQKAKLPLSDIGELTNLSPSGVSSVRRKLYKRAFGSCISTKEWDDLISSL